MKIQPNIKYYDIWKYMGNKWVMIDWDLTKQNANKILSRVNEWEKQLYAIQESEPLEDEIK